MELVYGPIVGFRVLTRTLTYSTSGEPLERVPIYMSAIYNTCACNISSFRRDSAPYSMQTTAVRSSPQQQYLRYQKDTIGFYHGQNCGSYSVRLDPELSFLSLGSTGSNGPRGVPFIDSMILQKTTLNDIGQYNVQMIIEQKPEKFGQGYNLPKPGFLAPITYDFVITIQPCRVGKYEVEIQPERLSYIIGDDVISGGYYSFVDDNKCGYPETVTLKDLPQFLIHNEGAQDFTVAYMEDVSQAGIYQIELTSVISYPTSATDSTPLEESANSNFEVILIDPCTSSQMLEWKIDTIVAKIDESSIIIELTEELAQDQASLEFGNQDGFSLCGSRNYALGSQNSVYSSFMQFDGIKTITVTATQFSDIGDHFIIMKASMTNYPQVATADTVLHVVIEGCTIETLSFTQVTPQVYELFLTSNFQFSFNSFLQEPNCEYDLEYQIQAKDVRNGQYDPLPSFLKFDGSSQFTVQDPNVIDLGVYFISIIARVPTGFPTFKDETEMLIEIQIQSGCLSDEIYTSFEVQPIDYSIGMTEIIEISPTWEQNLVQGCAYQFQVKRIENGEPRSLSPAEALLITQNAFDGKIQIYNEENYALDGQSWIIQIIKLSEFSEAQNKAGIIQFEINWNEAPCIDDTVSTSYPIEDRIHFIGSTGPEIESPIWSQLKQACPLVYEIFILESGNQRELSFEEAELVQFINKNGSVLIENENQYQYEKQDWTIVIVGKSVDSKSINNQASIQFTITWQDPCHDSQLKAAEFIDTPALFELYSTIRIVYKSMQDLSQGYACRGYQNSFKYISGPAYDGSVPYGADLSQFNFKTISLEKVGFEGFLTDQSWIGTHRVQIQSRNGVYSEDSIRGQNGQFGSINSEIFEFKIVDPCINMIINSDNSLQLEDMIAPDDVSVYESVFYSDPQRILQLGPDDYRNCGQFSYALLTKENQNFEESWFKLNVFDGQDLESGQFQFVLEQNIIFTKVILVDLTLEIRLENYPDSTPALLPITISTRECAPSNFSFGLVPEQVINTGSNQQKIVKIEHTQTPCDYQLDYVIFLENGGAIPNFIKYEQVQNIISIEGTTDDDIGEYNVVLKAQLYDPDQTISQTSFLVRVIDPCIDSVVNSDSNLVLDDIIAPANVSVFESRLYDAPQIFAQLNDVGVLMSCGPLSYKLFTNENEIFNEDWLVIDQNEKDQFSFILEQKPAYMKVVYLDLILQIKLEEHAKSIPALLPITVGMRECVPTNFAFDKIPNIVFNVGDSSDAIQTTHSQTPCEYKIDYSIAYQSDDGYKVQLPSFVSYDFQNQIFSIDNPTDENIGSYTIILEAQLHDPDQTRSETTFIVLVQDLCKDSIVNGDNVLIIQDMIGPENVSTVESQRYSAPTNSAEVSLGGNRSCGPLSYTLITAEGYLFDEKWFILNQEQDGNFFFVLEQNPLFMKVIVYEIMLEIRLSQHSKSTPALIPFKVSQRQCVPTDFQFNQVSNQVMLIGQDKLEIQMTQSQYPCNYQIDYSAFLDMGVDSPGEILPQFIVYDEIMNKITVQSPQKVSIGEYQIVIVAQLQDPDMTKSDMSFTLYISDSCEDSVLNVDNVLVLENMIAPDDVNFMESQLYNAPINSVDKNTQGLSQCGPLVYTLLSNDQDVFQENWLNINFSWDSESQQEQFQFQLTQNPLYTQLIVMDLILEIRLEEYPQSKPTYLPFQTIKRVCVPTNFQFTTIPDITIYVGQSTNSVQITHSQAPCEYQIEYTAFMLTNQNLQIATPAFVQFDSVENKINISRPTELDIGQYTIGLQAKLEDNENTSIQTYFRIQVEDPCIDAVLNNDGSLILSDIISPQDVSGYNSQLYFSPSNSAEQDSGGLNNCGPLSFTLLNSSDLSVFDEEWLWINESVDLETGKGQFSFELEQNPLYTKVTMIEFIVKIKLVDQPDSSPALLPIQVSFRECEPSNFDFDPIPNQVILAGESQTIIDVKHSQYPCDFPIEYSTFMYSQSDLEKIPLPQFLEYDAEMQRFTISQTTEADLGEYQIILEAQLNDPNQTKSLTIFTVKIFYSCSDSVVNSDNLLALQSVIAPDGVETFESKIYNAPQNSAYLSSGGQVDCGSLKYILLDQDKQIFDDDWFSLELLQNKGSVKEQFQFVLEQNPLFTKVIMQQFYLRIELDEYPYATPALLSFTVSVRECAPTDFMFDSVLEQEFYVGQSQKVIKLQQSQSPCNYNISHTAFIYQNDVQIPKPEFIDLQVESDVKIAIDKATLADVGLYKITIEAQLDNTEQTKRQVTVSIRILDPCSEMIVNSDNSLILQDLIAPDNVSTYESQLYGAPLNKVELEFKNQECGPLTYNLMSQDMEVLNYDWLQIQFDDDNSNFYFVLEQNPNFTKVVQKQFYLEIMLERYPESTPALLPINISLRECVPIDFSFSEISEKIIIIGSDSGLTKINVQHSQSPCNYDIEYSVFQLNSNSQQVSLPDFITYDYITQTMTIEHQLLEGQIGDYTIGLKAQIKDPDYTISQIKFDIKVILDQSASKDTDQDGNTDGEQGNDGNTTDGDNGNGSTDGSGSTDNTDNGDDTDSDEKGGTDGTDGDNSSGNDGTDDSNSSGNNETNESDGDSSDYIEDDADSSSEDGNTNDNQSSGNNSGNGSQGNSNNTSSDNKNQTNNDNIDNEPEEDTVSFVFEKPEWLEKLQETSMSVDGSLVYQIGNASNQFDELMTVEVDFGEASEFASFNSDDYTIYFNSTLMNNANAGHYEIIVRIHAIYPNNLTISNFENSFILNVNEGIQIHVEDNDEQEQQDETVEKEVFIMDWPGPIYNTIEEISSDEKFPIPYVSDISIDGILKISWDQKMKEISDFEALRENNIAVRYNPKFSRRMLQKENFVMLTNETSFETEQFKIFEPLEVFLRDEADEDEVDSKLEWQILKSTEDYTLIKINFKDANSFAPLADQVSLIITFWGEEFFISQKDKSVRLGTQINWQIYRQISQDENEKVGNFDSWFDVNVALAILILPICFFGLTVPVWMFFNTLQLIAHLPLLNTAMPANLHKFLMKYLDLMRLNINQTSQNLEESSNISKFWLTQTENEIYSNHNSLLQLCGYGTLFVNNTVVLLSIIALTALVSLTFVFKDNLCSNKCKEKLSIVLRKNYELMVSNFALRFLYEAFLELTICAFISLSVSVASSQASILSWLISLVITCMLLALTCFLISKLFRGGPNVKDYYLPLNFEVLFCWKARKRNFQFDHQAHKSHHLLRQKSLSLATNENLVVPISHFNSKQIMSKVPPTSIITSEQIQTERGLLLETEQFNYNHRRYSSIDSNYKQDNNKAGLIDLEFGSGMIYNSPYQNQEICRDGRATEALNSKANSASIKQEFNSGKNTQKNHDGQTPVVLDCLNENVDIDTRNKKQIENVGSSGSFQQESDKFMHMITSKIRSINENKNTLSKDHQLENFEGGQIELILKNEMDQVLKAQIKTDLDVESSIVVSNRYKTIFNGLKLNQERNVAVVYPIAFLFRRVLFAFIIVFMSSVRHTGLFLFMGYTLFMLAYACVEHQWQVRSVNAQHIFNEAVMYVFCLFLVYFSILETSTESRFTLGYIFISLFIVWASTNFSLVIWQTIKLSIMLIKRSLYRKRSRVLNKQVKFVVKNIKNTFKKININLFPWQKDIDECDQIQVSGLKTQQGGHSYLFTKKKADHNLKYQNQQQQSFIVQAITNVKPNKEGQIVPITSQLRLSSALNHNQDAADNINSSYYSNEDDCQSEKGHDLFVKQVEEYSSQQQQHRKIPMPTITTKNLKLDLQDVHEDAHNHADDKTPSKEVERYQRPDSKCEVSILSREDYNQDSGDSYDLGDDKKPELPVQEKSPGNNLLSQHMSSLMRDLQPILENNETTSDILARSSLLQKRASSKLSKNKKDEQQDHLNHSKHITDHHTSSFFERLENLIIDAPSAASNENSAVHEERRVHDLDEPLSSINQGTTLVEEESHHTEIDQLSQENIQTHSIAPHQTNMTITDQTVENRIVQEKNSVEVNVMDQNDNLDNKTEDLNEDIDDESSQLELVVLKQISLADNSHHKRNNSLKMSIDIQCDVLRAVGVAAQENTPKIFQAKQREDTFYEKSPEQEVDSRRESGRQDSPSEKKSQRAHSISPRVVMTGQNENEMLYQAKQQSLLEEVKANQQKDKDKNLLISEDDEDIDLNVVSERQFIQTQKNTNLGADDYKEDADNRQAQQQQDYNTFFSEQSEKEGVNEKDQKIRITTQSDDQDVNLLLDDDSKIVGDIELDQNDEIQTSPVNKVLQNESKNIIQNPENAVTFDEKFQSSFDSKINAINKLVVIEDQDQNYDNKDSSLSGEFGSGVNLYEDIVPAETTTNSILPMINQQHQQQVAVVQERYSSKKNNKNIKESSAKKSKSSTRRSKKTKPKKSQQQKAIDDNRLQQRMVQGYNDSGLRNEQPLSNNSGKSSIQEVSPVLMNPIVATPVLGKFKNNDKVLNFFKNQNCNKSQESQLGQIVPVTQNAEAQVKQRSRQKKLKKFRITRKYSQSVQDGIDSTVFSNILQSPPSFEVTQKQQLYQQQPTKNNQQLDQSPKEISFSLADKTDKSNKNYTNTILKRSTIQNSSATKSQKRSNKKTKPGVTPSIVLDPIIHQRDNFETVVRKSRTRVRNYQQQNSDNMSSNINNLTPQQELSPNQLPQGRQIRAQTLKSIRNNAQLRQMKSVHDMDSVKSKGSNQISDFNELNLIRAIHNDQISTQRQKYKNMDAISMNLPAISQKSACDQNGDRTEGNRSFISRTQSRHENVLPIFNVNCSRQNQGAGIVEFAQTARKRVSMVSGLVNQSVQSPIIDRGSDNKGPPSRKSNAIADQDKNIHLPWNFGATQGKIHMKGSDMKSSRSVSQVNSDTSPQYQQIIPHQQSSFGAVLLDNLNRNSPLRSNTLTTPRTHKNVSTAKQKVPNASPVINYPQQLQNFQITEKRNIQTKQPNVKSFIQSAEKLGMLKQGQHRNQNVKNTHYEQRDSKQRLSSVSPSATERAKLRKDLHQKLQSSLNGASNRKMSSPNNLPSINFSPSDSHRFSGDNEGYYPSINTQAIKLEKLRMKKFMLAHAQTFYKLRPAFMAQAKQSASYRGGINKGDNGQGQATKQNHQLAPWHKQKQNQGQETQTTFK